MRRGKHLGVKCDGEARADVAIFQNKLPVKLLKIHVVLNSFILFAAQHQMVRGPGFGDHRFTGTDF